MPQFDFPTLTLPSIMEFLAEFFTNSGGYCEEDLLKPQPSKIRQLYTDLLAVSNMPVHPESFNVQPFHGFHHAEHPELHEGSFPLVSFSLVMKRCLSSCGATDFKIWDLTCPKPKRTCRFISALINWKRFTDNRLAVYDKIKSDMVTLQERRAELLGATNEAKTKINKIQAKKAEKEPELQQLQEEIDAMTMKMSEYQWHQAKVQSELQQTKTDTADKTAKIDQIKCHQLELKEQADKLRSLIVQSPERMKSEIMRTKHNIQALRTAKEEISFKIQDLGILESKREASLENAVQGVKLISAINTELQKQREVEDTLKGVQDKLSGHKDVLRDTTATVNQLKRQCTIKHDKLSKILLQHESKMRSINEDIQVTVKAREALREKQSETNISVSKLNDVKLKKRKELESELHRHQQDMKTMEQQYKTLQTAIKENNAVLADAWDKNNPKNIFCC
ncbi:kinetochore protein Nuf2-A-like [Saccoglossus kowalevskii]|uniref:Kinetochore protein Nuf2-like n=1 Tax=Saccoglossus kowalevskii TaxID=10224 RepID=A0ABM0MJ65_SACKO|nr:PREDICTED: kinetochore protein Nuf2-like [Saccoglossus kowalevskii]